MYYKFLRYPPKQFVGCPWMSHGELNQLRVTSSNVQNGRSVNNKTAKSVESVSKGKPGIGNSLPSPSFAPIPLHQHSPYISFCVPSILCFPLSERLAGTGLACAGVGDRRTWAPSCLPFTPAMQARTGYESLNLMRKEIKSWEYPSSLRASRPRAQELARRLYPAFVAGVFFWRARCWIRRLAISSSPRTAFLLKIVCILQLRSWFMILSCFQKISFMLLMSLEAEKKFLLYPFSILSHQFIFKKR